MKKKLRILAALLVSISSGSVTSSGFPTGKVVELDYETKEVLFEATITPPNALFIITFHNVQRMSFYD